MADPLAGPIDRLVYEAQYVRDVLFLAGPVPHCRVSVAAMGSLYEGLSSVITELRKLQSQAVAAAPPGGAAPPPAGG